MTTQTSDDAPILRIGGLERLSLVDWPDELAAVIFCQGCGWDCRYCHNPHLIPFDRRGDFDWQTVLAWLQTRCGLLDGVVFSGGEATLQPGLLAALKQVRALGFKTALHTGGPMPSRMAMILPYLDWVGFDFKAPWDRYAKVTGNEQGRMAQESFGHLIASGVACEIRTTWHPALHSTDDLLEMAATLRQAGVRRWVIQRFRPDGCEDKALCAHPVGNPPVEELLAAGGLEIVVR